MKKKIIIVLALLLVISLSGCTKKSNQIFKESYESLNGKTNAKGAEHRTVNIDKNNPFEIVTDSDIVKKIENGETFYVYFGDKLCPWCRSVIEKFISIAKEKGIKKVYYVAIWDDNGNEIVRDKYTKNEDGSYTKTIDGTDSYKKLLEYFDSVLKDYTMGEDSMNEKRIYAPNFFYVKDGKVVKMTSGISEKQTDSRGELTEEILEDEEKLFKEFFE